MTTTRLVALAACAALALGGCSDDDPEPQITDPSANPTSTPSDDRTAEPDEPPELPAAARKRSASGARAFVKYYWDVANFAQRTGETEELKALSADSCAGCEGAITFIEGVYNDSGEIVGGSYSVSNLRLNELRAGDTVLFDCDFKTTNTRQVVKRDGEQKQVFPASSVDVRFTVSFGPSGWQVDQWDPA